MATKLTTPIARPPETSQAVVRIEVQIPHKQNQAGDIVIDRPAVSLVYGVQTYNAHGAVVGRRSRKIEAGQWPQALRNLIKTLYEGIEADAKANGIIQPGTDEALS